MRRKAKRARLDDFIDAASDHGDQSDTEHEVGDLQDLVRECANVMTEDQIEAVRANLEDRLEWLKE